MKDINYFKDEDDVKMKRKPSEVYNWTLKKKDDDRQGKREIRGKTDAKSPRRILTSTRLRSATSGKPAPRLPTNLNSFSNF